MNTETDLEEGILLVYFESVGTKEFKTASGFLSG